MSTKNKRINKTRQKLDETHVSHDLRISAMGIGITLGALRRIIAEWPDEATLKFALNGDTGWARLESVSYCQAKNEVSLW